MPIIDRTAWRSGNNYAHLLAQKLDAKITDLTCSGATLLNVLDQPQKHMLSSTPPQLESLPKDATIVTLTAGGNDMGYIGGMMIDGVKASLHAVPLLGELFPPSAHEEEEHLSSAEVAKRFIAVIDRIKSIAPNAIIYLVEYLVVLGRSAVRGPDNPLTEEQIEHHQRMGQALSEAYQAAVDERPGTRLVKMSELSDSHGVGSTEPWMVGFTPFMLLNGEVPYHPNLKGHQAMAEELYKRINDSIAE